MQGARVGRPDWTELSAGSCTGLTTALTIWTLALLTISEGAKRGANVHWHRATSADVQRFSLPLESASGDTERCQGDVGEVPPKQ